MDGIEATKIIKTTCPDVLVVILTAFEDAEHLEKALEAEADGYLTKDIGTKELIAALHDVFLGERVFSKSIVNLLQSTYGYNDTSSIAHISISKREQEILNYVALGKTSLEISQILNISHRTVQSHRSNIMQKLRIKTAGELIRYAVINYSRPTLYND
jgi:DNA-binding NarL/FixJ family response regulator